MWRWYGCFFTSLPVRQRGGKVDGGGRCGRAPATVTHTAVAAAAATAIAAAVATAATAGGAGRGAGGGGGPLPGPPRRGVGASNVAPPAQRPSAAMDRRAVPPASFPAIAWSSAPSGFRRRSRQVTQAHGKRLEVPPVSMSLRLFALFASCHRAQAWLAHKQRRCPRKGEERRRRMDGGLAVGKAVARRPTPPQPKLVNGARVPCGRRAHTRRQWATRAPRRSPSPPAVVASPAAAVAAVLRRLRQRCRRAERTAGHDGPVGRLRARSATSRIGVYPHHTDGRGAEGGGGGGEGRPSRTTACTWPPFSGCQPVRPGGRRSQ